MKIGWTWFNSIQTFSNTSRFNGFSRTASQAISNVLMPLLLEAGEDGGFENLVWHQVHLRSGIYLFKGALTNFYLSERFDLKYTDLNLLIASQR